MKSFLLLSVVCILILSSCSDNKSDVSGDNSFIIGSWTIDNLNSVDSSVNRETLLTTVIAAKFRDKNILSFAKDYTVALATNDGKELGKGIYNIIDTSAYLTIKFPKDKIESRYEIKEKSERSLKLKAYNDGETINISLIRNPE